MTSGADSLPERLKVSFRGLIDKEWYLVVPELGRPGLTEQERLSKFPVLKETVTKYHGQMIDLFERIRLESTGSGKTKQWEYSKDLRKSLSAILTDFWYDLLSQMGDVNEQLGRIEGPKALKTFTPHSLFLQTARQAMDQYSNAAEFNVWVHKDRVIELVQQRS